MHTYTHFTPTDCSPLIVSRGSLFYYKASWDWPTSKDVSVSRPLNASISSFLLSIDCNIHLGSYSTRCAPLNDIASSSLNPLILLHLSAQALIYFYLLCSSFSLGLLLDSDTCTLHCCVLVDLLLSFSFSPNQHVQCNRQINRQQIHFWFKTWLFGVCQGHRNVGP